MRLGALLGAQIETRGHRVVLLPPAQVRPYVLRNKTDRTDTRGILEAHPNEGIHPVPIKTLDQQALTSLHRIRSAWVAERTAKINLLRGLLREPGLVMPVGAKKAVPHAWAFIDDDALGILAALRPVFAELCHEMGALRERIDGAERQLEAVAKHSIAAARLRAIPGVGLLVATGVLAFTGDIRRFPSGVTSPVTLV